MRFDCTEAGSIVKNCDNRSKNDCIPKKSKILPRFGALGERRPWGKVSAVRKCTEKDETGIRLARKDQRFAQVLWVALGRISQDGQEF